jgi:hypothetical protein
MLPKIRILQRKTKFTGNLLLRQYIDTILCSQALYTDLQQLDRESRYTHQLYPFEKQYTCNFITKSSTTSVLPHWP